MNPPPAGQASKLLYAATLFLGAFLLFLLEPLIAKSILPWFGGSASVWTTCLVFFQAALLLGYLYADRLTHHMAPGPQAWLHISLLVLSLLFLPIAPKEFWRLQTGLDPSLAILGLLATSIGLPFVVLSATSPLLQAWYARRHPGEEPYFLFSVSNFASLLALLSFPLLVEPNLNSRSQSLLWSALFGLFAAGCGFLAWSGRKDAVPTVAAPVETSPTEGKPFLRTRLLWLSLSACGSMLLLSMTHELCLNVAPVPLLWVLPLALYLSTFILAFHRQSLYPRKAGAWLLAAALAGLGLILERHDWLHRLQISLPSYLLGLFLTCLFCHGELAARRPDAKHLTSFYLILSLGGALGAVGVGLAAPILFKGIYEYHLTLFLTALLALWVLWPKGWWVRGIWVLGTAALAYAAIDSIRSYEDGSLMMTRNFYAGLQVAQEGEGDGLCRVLYSGTILHGDQFLDPQKSMEPTSYYSHESGVGMALRLSPAGPRHVGLIGLGAGTLAAYGRKGDFFRFYDINPQAPGIAQNWFSFLKNSPAQVDIVLGDARLSLQSEPPQGYDLLVVDAFTGDAIPVHLLTKEAFDLYLRHLKPGGILAIHTSNLFLRLEEVVKLLADQEGYPCRYITNDEDDDRRVEASDWVIVTRNPKFLGDKAVLDASDEVTPAKGLRPWTDGDNNLFQVLRPLKDL